MLKVLAFGSVGLGACLKHHFEPTLDIEHTFEEKYFLYLFF